MAIISMFYGIIISMYYFEKNKLRDAAILARSVLASNGEEIFKIEPLK